MQTDTAGRAVSHGERSSFLFLNANTPWVYALAENLARRHPTHAVRLYGWRVYWQNQPSWPDQSFPAGLTRSFRVLPPGYAGRLERLARPFMRWMVCRWQDALRGRSEAEPWVVAPYPYLAPWLDTVPDERLIYYNLDAYTLYRPERAASIRENEERLVARAALSLCLSEHQVQALRQRYPAHAERIHHFPLGVTENFINPHPERPPDARTVGYVGNLTDRVDWPLVRAVAERLPDVRFVFVGGLDESKAGEGWKQDRQAALHLPNVEHVGRVPQEEVTAYYWSFAVNWIPYDPDHPFNKASGPTKVMDTMATGRPIVSTSVPECRLYPEWIEIADTAYETAATVRRLLREGGGRDERQQVDFARQHTWRRRTEQLLELIANRPALA